MTHNWLEFKIENLHMAVSLSSICKIKDKKELTEEREKELKLYSGKELLGLGEKREEENTVLFTRQEHYSLVFTVDEVVGLLEIREEDIMEMPSFGKREDTLTKSIGIVEDRIVQFLDLQRLTNLSTNLIADKNK
ncbi:chemotaxis protein CheW [Priestia endophytica]|uniref:chemotaxis protein CheW n=1 Tax=Priestia filamentosa TaxID=1402861 RepID=UPI003D272B6A